MEGNIEKATVKRISWYKYAISAVVLTAIVFCLDEGNNNFDWATDFGNWIVFVVYASFVLFGQILFAYLLSKRKKIKSAHLISILCGGLFGLSMAIAFFLFILKP